MQRKNGTRIDLVSSIAQEGRIEAWESLSPTQGATPKRGSPYPQLKGPLRSVGVRIPNSRGHSEAWESVSPTQGVTPKRGSPYPQLKGPPRSVGVRIPNSRGHTKAWEFITPTRGASNVEERTVNRLSSIAAEG